MKTTKMNSKSRLFYHSTFSLLSSFFAATLVSFITCTDPALGELLTTGPVSSNDFLIDSQSEEFDYWMGNHFQNMKEDRMPGMGFSCMFQIEDAKVTERPSADGVTINYESQSGQIDLLQKHVQAIADHHNMMQASASRTGMGMGMGLGRGPQTRPWGRMAVRRMVDSLATVSLTDTGANLTFKPINSADLSQLRDQIHQRLAAKPAAGCLMAP